MQTINPIKSKLSRSIRGLRGQALANLLPIWTEARKHYYSNLQAMLGDISAETLDSELNSLININNSKIKTSLLNSRANVYAYPIEEDFIFEFNQVGSSIKYVYPSVTGYLNGMSYELLNSYDNNINAFLNSIAVDISSVQQIYEDYDITNFIYEINLDEEYTEIFLPVDEYIYFEVSDITALGQVNNLNTYFNRGEIEVVNSRFPNEMETVFINTNGTYSTKGILKAGYYKVKCNFLTTASIYAYTIPVISSYKDTGLNFYNQVNGKEFSIQLWADDKAYLTFEGQQGQSINDNLLNNEDNIVLQRFVLLDDENEFVTGLDLAKHRYEPILYVLDADNENRLYLYDSFLDQAQSPLDNNDQYGLDLVYEDMDWEIGEIVTFKTRKGSAFMSDNISALRLSIYTMSNDEIVYIDPSGNEVNANLAWVGLNGYTEKRWDYEIQTYGTHSIELEIKYKNGQQGTSKTLLHIPYKNPLAAIDIELPNEEIASQVISLASGDIAIVTEENNVYKVSFIYNETYVDYENYVIYTSTLFDQIDIDND